MSKKLKILICIILIITLYIFGMSTVVNAEDTAFSLSDTEVTILFNSTKYIYCKNKPTRSNSNLGE